jgi:WD40 repeat protein
VFAASVSVWKLTDTACTLVDATHSRQTPADETGRAKEKFKRIFKGLGRKGDTSDKILYQITFSPNAEYIAGLSIDGSAYIWKARTLALARPLSAKNLAPLWQHSVTPNSRGIFYYFFPPLPLIVSLLPPPFIVSPFPSLPSPPSPRSLSSSPFLSLSQPSFLILYCSCGWNIVVGQ